MEKVLYCLNIITLGNKGTMSDLQTHFKEDIGFLAKKDCTSLPFVHYISLGILVRQKHWALFEHFSGIFLEN